jgi:hypothetical protein
MDYTKMKRVPLNSGGQAITNPVVSKITNVHEKMGSILQQKGGHETVIRYRQALLDYLHYMSQLRGPRVHSVASSRNSQGNMWEGGSIYDTADATQPRVPTEAQVNDIVTAITQRPDIVSFTPQGQLQYRGRTIPDTDIVDLM